MLRKFSDFFKLHLTMNDNSEIISAETNRFLGRAGENYFFYSPIRKATTIIKSTEVKRIEIKK